MVKSWLYLTSKVSKVGVSAPVRPAGVAGFVALLCLGLPAATSRAAHCDTWLRQGGRVCEGSGGDDSSDCTSPLWHSRCGRLTLSPPR